MNGLVFRGLTYYWRTNLAVVFGVATAVAVLAGALLVGDSVRGSLRDLVVGRLGKTDYVVISSGFFREQLAADIQAQHETAKSFSNIVPLVVANAIVSVQQSERKAGQVRVYGVDDRFWRFHGVDGVSGPTERDAYVSPALAAQLDASADSVILVRIQRPTDIPLESLHGRRDKVGQTLRLTVRRVLPAESLGEFSLDATQADVRAVFVPLSRLQQDLSVPARVNAMLASGSAGAASELERLLRRSAQLEDVGINVKALDDRRGLAIGADAGLLDDPRVAALREAYAGSTLHAESMFTYLANSMRVGDREVPYSLVTAIETVTDGIVLNEWAGKELNARPGDQLTMEYYLFEDPGQLTTRTATFRVSRIVGIDAGDRDMAPTFPGISDSPTLESWDPPFPVDLRRIRPQDERYWEQYRTTPKAFVSLQAGQELWRSRYGALTSIRLTDSGDGPVDRVRDEITPRLRAAIDPLALGLTVSDIRAQSLDASRGATDFGEYFVYFSFFLVVSALVLAALFFKLGVEQRVREVGLLRAVGFGPGRVRRLFLGEGLVLAIVGGAFGVAGALAYASVIMFGLRTWWVEAVGTTSLTLHVTPVSLAAGAVGGIVAAVACIWWTLRALGRISERSLLAGEILSAGDVSAGLTSLRSSSYGGPPEPWRRRKTRRYGSIVVTVVLAVLGVVLLVAGASGWIAREGAFFGAGSALLIACLCAFSLSLRRHGPSALVGHGWQPVSRLGFRYARYRPGRSVLSMAVIASATFVLISVDAFRRGETPNETGIHSGVGGYGLLVETLLPIVDDANSRSGRTSLNLFDLDPAVTFEPFRLLPGDDASCLNLYEPRNPRILAPSDAFLAKGRFAFQASSATTDAERTNPWLLLQRVEQDGAIPVIGDANSMTYVLHKQIGDEVVIRRGGKDVRLRLVAALRDSIFQGELLMSQANFIRLFPDQQGYRVMLVETPPAQTAAVAARIEDALADLGADATSTSERLAQFHRVENTYLSTFQALGGLGLVLGTIGLATVLLRNVLERRRELALLGAVGFRSGHVLTMVVAENVLLLGCGLIAGAVCAGLAIAPAVLERGGRVPLTSGGALLLFAVFITGLLSSIVAMNAATRAPLLASLRSE